MLGILPLFTVNEFAQELGELPLEEVITLLPTGIASAEAFGTPSLGQAITISTGIASAEAFGVPSLAQAIEVAGIPSAEAFGIPTIEALGLDLSPAVVPQPDVVHVLSERAIAGALRTWLRDNPSNLEELVGQEVMG